MGAVVGDVRSGVGGVRSGVGGVGAEVAGGKPGVGVVWCMSRGWWYNNNIIIIYIYIYLREIDTLIDRHWWQC